MKLQLFKFILETLLNLILKILEKNEETEKQREEERESLKQDVALAEKCRQAYPSLSDEAIMKELC